LSKDDIWEFGKHVNGKEVYIKVKVYPMGKGKIYGRCLSFHFPKKEKEKIEYPYKEGT
jgi:hypothetical protein